MEIRRKLQINDLARKKRLSLWGKHVEAQKPKKWEGVQLQEILYNILTDDIRVWLWAINGECVYAGTRDGALNEHGSRIVKRWRLEGEIFRADVAAEDSAENLREIPPETEVERDGK